MDDQPERDPRLVQSERMMAEARLLEAEAHYDAHTGAIQQLMKHHDQLGELAVVLGGIPRTSPVGQMVGAVDLLQNHLDDLMDWLRRHRDEVIVERITALRVELGIDPPEEVAGGD